MTKPTKTKAAAATPTPISVPVTPSPAGGTRRAPRRGVKWLVDLLTNLQFLGGLAIGLVGLGIFFTVEYFKLATEEEVDAKITEVVKPINDNITGLRSDIETFKVKGLEGVIKLLQDQADTIKHLDTKLDDLHNDLYEVKIDIATFHGKAPPGSKKNGK